MTQQTKVANTFPQRQALRVPYTTLIAYSSIFIIPCLCAYYYPDYAEHFPRWIGMWIIVMQVFIGAKILSWRGFTYTGRHNRQRLRTACYYHLLWCGLNPQQFLNQAVKHQARRRQLISSLVMICLGLALLFLLIPYLPNKPQHIPDWARAWIGMIGMSCFVHFGILQLLALCWQRLGYYARPIMNSPLLPHSIADFWGKRWNTAFHDLTYQHIYKGSIPFIGTKAAVGVAFLFSGLVHEIVVSLPAGGGYGLPTLYFLIQGVAVLLCRSPFGKSIHLDHGLNGWLFAACVLLIPVPLLFHHAFLNHIVLPLLEALGV